MSKEDLKDFCEKHETGIIIAGQALLIGVIAFLGVSMGYDIGYARGGFKTLSGKRCCATLTDFCPCAARV
jgi:hypothetical protein